jgi:hypothetical protein
MGKKQTPRTQASPPSPEEAFDTDFTAIISEWEAAGRDPSKEVILADGCFMYHGHVFAVDEQVRAKTRIEGRYMEAKVTAVTTAEIELTFRDHSIVSIDRDLLVSGAVAFLLPA